MKHINKNLLKTKQIINFKKTILNNNLRIITEEIPYVESFALGITINGGSRDEPLQKSGIAHFLEHSVFRRSKKMNSKQIASQFESLGAYTNAFTTQEITCFYVRALTEHFVKILKILNEITFNPSFVPREIEKERHIIYEEIKSYEDDPEEYILDIGDRQLYGEHPLGNPIIGTADSLSLITIDDLVNYHEKFYSLSNITFTFAGALPHEFVVEKIFNQVRNNFNSKPIIISRVTPEVTIPSKIEIVNPMQQAHLLLGKPTLSYKHPDKNALAVLNILFGDGLSSRLYQNLRDKYGIAYTIYSSSQLYSDCGSFYIYAATDKSKVNKTKELVFKEIEKLDTISENDLKRAKVQYKTGIIMELESMSARMQSLAKMELLEGELETLQTTLEKVDKISMEDIQRVVKSNFSDFNWHEAVLIPKK
jgi:predicted Zn-dependent peptidase